MKNQSDGRANLIIMMIVHVQGPRSRYIANRDSHFTKIVACTIGLNETNVKKFIPTITAKHGNDVIHRICRSFFLLPLRQLWLLLLIWLKSTVLIACVSFKRKLHDATYFFFSAFLRYDRAAKFKIGNWKRNKNKFSEWFCTLITLSLALALSKSDPSLCSFYGLINSKIASDGLWWVCVADTLATDF